MLQDRSDMDARIKELEQDNLKLFNINKKMQSHQLSQAPVQE